MTERFKTTVEMARNEGLLSGEHFSVDGTLSNLWYDADGSGKKAAMLMAVLDNHVQIAYTDFWIV
jgi:hypothetical protein